MKIPTETKPALWGVAGGAVAVAILGFTWGGWVTGGKADANASQRADAAVVMALAPVCVEKFHHTAGVSANVTALKKIDSWLQGECIEKRGWAAVPDLTRPIKCPQWPKRALYCSPARSSCQGEWASGIDYSVSLTVVEMI